MAIKGDLAQILSGMPVQIKECNLAIVQPTVKTIVAYGEDNFFTGLQLFTQVEKLVEPLKEGNSQLSMISDFQLLIVAIQEDRSLKRVIDDLFEIIFPDYSFKVDPGLINFYTKENSDGRIIGQLNPNNFDAFQSCLKDLFIPAGSGETQQEYNPANKAAAEIAEKLKRGNQIRQEMKKEDSKMGTSLFASYISILSIGLSMDMNIFYNYTPFQLYNTFTRYTTKTAFDLYQKIATTPMMDISKMKEPKNWMEDIYSNN